MQTRQNESTKIEQKQNAKSILIENKIQGQTIEDDRPLRGVSHEKESFKSVFLDLDILG